MLIAGESELEFAQTKSDILGALQPRDALEVVLAERFFSRHWFSLRGQRATASRCSETVHKIVEEADLRDAREVDRLAGLIDSDFDAVRQLRMFPAGVVYLLNRWRVLSNRLGQNRNILRTERRLCFTLIAKTPESVLQGDPIATEWLRAQIGVMLGQEGTLEEVASFLGGQPPEGMEQDEFDIRVSILAKSLRPRAESFFQLRRLVAGEIRKLRALQVTIKEVADRKLQNAAESALVETTPEGSRLSSYILANERGCDSALRRLEIRQNPDRPGPKRGPKKPAATTDATDMAADAGSLSVETGADCSTYEPKIPTATPEPAADYSTYEPKIPTATSEPAADYSTYEANYPSITPETPADYSTYEPKIPTATPEPAADYSTYEPKIPTATPEPAAHCSTYEANYPTITPETPADYSTYEPKIPTATPEPAADYSTYEPKIPTATPEPAAHCSTYEANYPTITPETPADYSTYEPKIPTATPEPAADYSTYEANYPSITPKTPADYSTYEPKIPGATPEPAADYSTYEAIATDAVAAEDDRERLALEAEDLRKLRLLWEANHGDRRLIDSGGQGSDSEGDFVSGSSERDDSS